MGSGVSSTNAKLLRESNRVGVQFLLTEVDTGLTFLEVADTTGIRASRDRNLHLAGKAYATVQRLLTRVKPSPDERLYIEKRMSELRDGLNAAGYSVDSLTEENKERRDRQSGATSEPRRKDRPRVSGESAKANTKAAKARR